jgi:hypothetical protein
MTTKNRLIEFATKKGFGRNRFEDHVGIAIGYLSSKSKSVTSETIERVLNKFPELNANWLLTGIGKMEIAREIGRESDDSLYHFTTEFDGLLRIFNEGIKPQYSLEDMSFLEDDSEGNSMNTKFMAFPMFSLCDIPYERLSGADSLHRERYGKYGIGIKKEWAITQHIDTVHYTHNGTTVSKWITNLHKMFRKVLPMIRAASPQGINDYDIYDLFLNTYHHLFYAMMLCKSYSKDDSVFYDEKEWRYLPDVGNINKYLIHRNEYTEEFKNERNVQQKQREINKMIDLTLEFSVDDITHIFLENEDQKDLFVSKLNAAYSEGDIEKIRNLMVFDGQVTEKIEKEEGREDDGSLKKYIEVLEENRVLNGKIVLALEKIDVLHDNIHALNDTLGEAKNDLAEGVSAVKDALTRTGS